DRLDPEDTILPLDLTWIHRRADELTYSDVGSLVGIVRITNDVPKETRTSAAPWRANRKHHVGLTEVDHRPVEDQLAPIVCGANLCRINVERVDGSPLRVGDAKPPHILLAKAGMVGVCIVDPKEKSLPTRRFDLVVEEILKELRANLLDPTYAPLN